MTSVRFFFALWVLFYHFFGSTSEAAVLPGWLQNIIFCGYMGVSFFFMLSGFVLGYSYLGRPMNAANFWMARAARILPMYFFGLLLAAPFFFQDYRSTGFSHRSVIAAPLLLQSWIPGSTYWNRAAWSLSTEAFFYIVFPLALPIAVKLFTSKLRWISFTLLWAAAALPTCLVAFGHSYSIHDPAPFLEVVKYNPLVRLPEFLIGVGLSVLYTQGVRIARPKLTFFAGTAVLLSLAALTNGQPYPAFHNGLLAPLVGVFIYALASMPNALHWRVCILLGEASYSLYLIHLPIWNAFEVALRKLHQPDWNVLSSVLYVAVCVVGSVVTFQFVELPTKKWIMSWWGKCREARREGRG